MKDAWSVLSILSDLLRKAACFLSPFWKIGWWWLRGARKFLVDATIWGLKFFHAVIQARGWRHQGPIRCGGHGTRGTWRTLVRHGDFAPMHSLRVTIMVHQWMARHNRFTYFQTSACVAWKMHSGVYRSVTGSRKDGSLVPWDGTSAAWRWDGSMAG